MPEIGRQVALRSSQNPTDETRYLKGVVFLDVALQTYTERLTSCSNPG